jgi:hypothetical protein
MTTKPKPKPVQMSTKRIELTEHEFNWLLGSISGDHYDWCQQPCACACVALVEKLQQQWDEAPDA